METQQAGVWLLSRRLNTDMLNGERTPSCHLVALQVRPAWLKEAPKTSHTRALGDAVVQHHAEIFLDVSSVLTFSSPAREPAIKAHIRRHQSRSEVAHPRLGGQNRLALAAKIRLSCRCNLYLAVMFSCTF